MLPTNYGKRLVEGAITLLARCWNKVVSWLAGREMASLREEIKDLRADVSKLGEDG